MPSAPTASPTSCETVCKNHLELATFHDHLSEVHAMLDSVVLVRKSSATLGASLMRVDLGSVGRFDRNVKKAGIWSLMVAVAALLMAGAAWVIFGRRKEAPKYQFITIPGERVG
jgi:hypothetical protein